MRVLISGTGIAGPTLDFWLSRYGLEPTIVERAPRLRTGGYIIDFWGWGSTLLIAWGCYRKSAARDTSPRKYE